MATPGAGAGYAQLEAVYADAEQKLEAIIQNAITNGNSWTAHRAKLQLLQVQQIAAKLTAEAHGLAYQSVNAAAEAAHAAVGYHAPVTIGAGAGTAGAAGAAGTGVNQQAVMMLAEALGNALAGASQRVGRQAADVFQKVGVEQSAVGLATGVKRERVAANIADNLIKEGVTGFVDKAGRNWSLSAYTNMVARTTTREAVSLATRERMDELGMDLVTISEHGDTDEECAEYAGNTYSLNGTTEGYDELPDEPPFHPNCIHVMTPAEANMEQYLSTLMDGTPEDGEALSEADAQAAQDEQYAKDMEAAELDELQKSADSVPPEEKWRTDAELRRMEAEPELKPKAKAESLPTPPPADDFATALEPPDFKKIEDTPLNEPPVPPTEDDQNFSTGIIVREPDGRIWIVEPKDHYGGYEATFPKGRLDSPGLTPQQNAHKELWEETGLKAKVTGLVGDYKGKSGVTRYYLADRTGGLPHLPDHTPFVEGGKETATVKLMTPTEAALALNQKRDQAILKDVLHPEDKVEGVVKVEEPKAPEPKAPEQSVADKHTEDLLAQAGVKAKVGGGLSDAQKYKHNVFREQIDPKVHKVFDDLSIADKDKVVAEWESGVGSAQALLNVAYPTAEGGVSIATSVPLEAEPPPKLAEPPPSTGTGPIPDYSDQQLVVTGAAGGSTGAQFANGGSWLIKTYGGDENRVATELVSNAVYRETGALAPAAGIIERDGKTALAYPTLDGETHHIAGPSEELGEHFMTDALLGNWDFIGMSHDNILWTKDGAARLDQGGTLFYRAQGGAKPFGAEVKEVESLFGPKGQANGTVAITPEQMRAQAEHLATTLTPEKVHQIVSSAPFSDKTLAAEVEESLNARVRWLSEHYPPLTEEGKLRVAKAAKKAEELAKVVKLHKEAALPQDWKTPGARLAADRMASRADVWSHMNAMGKGVTATDVPVLRKLAKRLAQDELKAGPTVIISKDRQAYKAVQAATKANDSNPLWQAIQERYASDHVVLVEADKARFGGLGKRVEGTTLLRDAEAHVLSQPDLSAELRAHYAESLESVLLKTNPAAVDAISGASGQSFKDLFVTATDPAYSPSLVLPETAKAVNRLLDSIGQRSTADKWRRALGEKVGIDEATVLRGQDALPTLEATKQRVSREETKALRYYQDGEYHSINGHVRGGGTAEGNEMVRLMDSAMAKQQALSEDVVLYRGIRPGPFNPEVLRQDSFVEKGFMSTSFDQSFSRRWAGNDDQSVLLHVFMPAGSKGYLMKEIGESEFVSERGVELRVRKLIRSPGDGSPTERYSPGWEAEVEVVVPVDAGAQHAANIMDQYAPTTLPPIENTLTLEEAHAQVTATEVAYAKAMAVVDQNPGALGDKIKQDAKDAYDKAQAQLAYTQANVAPPTVGTHSVQLAKPANVEVAPAPLSEGMKSTVQIAFDGQPSDIAHGFNKLGEIAKEAIGYKIMVGGMTPADALYDWQIKAAKG